MQQTLRVFNRWLLCLLLFIPPGLSWAQSPLLPAEDFLTPGALTSQGWTAHSGSGTNVINAVSTNLTYQGLASAGGSAQLATSGEDINIAFPSTSSGAVYASFLVNVSSAQATGDYFFHFGNGSTSISTSFYGRVYVKSTAGGIQFGISKASEAAGPVYYSTPYALNTTYLLVVKYTFNTGSTTDDRVDLFIEPALGGSEPTANAGTTSANTDLTSLNRIALRQGSSAAAAGLNIDYIRVGNTWEAVTSTTSTTNTPIVNLSVSTNSASEVDQTVVTVTATASAPVTGSQTIQLAVTGTGITEGDYSLSSPTINIPDGSTSGSVTFIIVDDADVEAEETATLTISSPSAGIVLGSTVTQNITIADNDASSLTVSPAGLTGFATTQGTPSASQSYVLNASSLPGEITVTAPGGVEVSTDNATFSSSLLLSQSTTSATLYARLTGVAEGEVTGAITHVSEGLAADVTISGTVSAVPTPAGNSIVISQVYGGGNNSGAPYQNDFVELYNRGTSSVSLTSWSVQYASATGTGLFSGNKVDLSGTLAPGQYYLIKMAGGTTNGAVLPAPDATNTSINMGATGGKVILVNTTTGLPCNGGATPCSSESLAQILDLVGFGTANFYEGSAAAPAPSNSMAVLRKADGATDTNDNSADFVTGAPNPRNSAVITGPSLVAIPAALTAANALSYVEGSGPDSKAISVSGSNFATTTGQIILTSSNPNFTVSPASLPFGGSALSATTVTVQLAAGLPIGPYAGTITLTGGGATLEVPVEGRVMSSVATITLISTIQGAGPTTPLANSTVTIEGIVTRTFAGPTKLNGFYVQEEDEDTDGNPATSEGIFVFDPTGAFSGSAGDKVRITGTVAEFTSTSSGVTSSLTQLKDLTSVTNLGAGTTPTAVPVQLPVSSVSDLERYEGMLVNVSAVEGNLAVTEYFLLGRYGQVTLASTGSTNVAGTDARLDQYTQFNTPSVTGYAAYLAEVAKRKIILDDGSGAQNTDPILFGRGGQPLSATNPLRGGDEVASITAILDERFEGYRLQTTTGINFLPTNERPTTVPSVGTATLKVAGFNLLNYFNGNGLGGGFPTSRGANTLVEFNRQRAKTIKAIVESAVDVFAFNELENDGYGTTSAIQDIVNGVNDVLGAGTFTFINPGTSTGTDEITVAMIYKPGKVTPVGASAVIPNAYGNGAFDIAGRKPLAQTFRENTTGAVFTVVGNHWKSKGSSSAGSGNVDSGDGQGNSNGTRTRQAQDLISWLATDPTGSNDPDYLILGDLNAYAMEDPLTTLEKGGYTNLLPNTTYSYVFDGFTGALDHALGSPSLAQQVSGATKWHINADEPGILDYNTEFKSAGQLSSLYAADQFRTSDHDPVIVGLALVAPLSVTATATPTTICTNGTSELAATISGGSAPYKYTWSGPGTIATPSGVTTEVSGLPAGEHVFTVQVTDVFNQTASTTVTVTVAAQPEAPVLVSTYAVQGSADVVLSAANCAGTLVWTSATSGSGSSILVSTATAGTFTYAVQCQERQCVSTATSVSVTIIPLLTATVSASPDAILTNQSSNLAASVQGGTAPYTYEWTGPGTITNGNAATATVSGLTPGAKVFSVKITDSTLPTAQVITKTVDLTVTQANRAPIAGAIANQTATAGNPYSLDVKPVFSDPDNDALAYTATGLPAGLTMSNGVISGMPTTTGTSTITVTATDPGSLSASTSFMFIVLQGPLKILAPTYNCNASQLTVNIIAGNGNSIEYQIPSVSNGWEPKATYSIEAKHIGKELKLHARQRASDGKGYVEVEISFTPTACAANSRIGLPETERATELTLTVLGNPVAGEVSFEVRGAEGQPVQLRLLDLQGRIIEIRSIKAAAEVEQITLDVQRQPTGILLLQATTPSQQKIVKVMKQ